LWSLGATMYLLLSGQPVRERGSVTEQLLGAMTRPVPSLADVAALPRSVVAVVDRALAFDRDARFPDARSMQLAVRAVQDELSMPDSRATLPPPSVEPMALSLRTPRADGRHKRPSIPTVRPLAANVTPLPVPGAKPARSALPVYVTFGFAVGIGIVVAARLTMRPFTQTTYAAQPERTDSAPPVASPPSATPAPSVTVSSSASSAAPSAARAPLAHLPPKTPTDPLSRRK
jgi:eukaryotic-like serine/threonine-protein kinase